MKIGIDISQIVYKDTGVANFVTNVVNTLLDLDSETEYVLFYSSLRKKVQSSILRRAQDKIQSYSSKFKIKNFFIPPSILDILWNKLHIVPIEWLIGDVDVFITSDWTEPPARKAKKATILYDLIVYKYPDETDKKIVETQRRKLEWVKKESNIVFCISEATKKDAMEILGIEEKRLKVIYPGTT